MARIVYGQEVVKDQPTPSPISTNGRQILWTQTRTLTLADGSTAYGCAHCEYVSRNVLSIRPHLGKHNRRNGTSATRDLPLQQVLKQINSLEEITAQRDQWKARAVKAEGALRSLREALGVPL